MCIRDRFYKKRKSISPVEVINAKKNISSIDEQLINEKYEILLSYSDYLKISTSSKDEVLEGIKVLQ